MGDSTKKRLTIMDVARTAGVSKTTVSRYLSKQYGNLAEPTRKKIQEAIQSLNFQPNRMAAGLKGGRSYLIGMVVADITNPFTVRILHAAEVLCRSKGYSLMVCNTNNDSQLEREYIFMLQSHRIDGLVINTSGQNNQFLKDMADQETSVVLVDRRVPELGFDFVGVDNIAPTREAVRFLIAHGYETIGFFSQPIDGISTRRERMNAFQSVLTEHNHPSFENIYELKIDDEESLDKQMENFLEASSGRKRAIFSANGVVTLAVLKEIQKRGLRIPEDISLVSFDDPEWAGVLTPALTTISQPTEEIGRQVIERVFKRIEGDKEEPQELILPAEFIVRASTL